MKRHYSSGRSRVRFGVTRVLILVISASGTKQTCGRKGAAVSEERTLRIPANIGSEQWELNLAIHCEFPTAFVASLIHRNF